MVCPPQRAPPVAKFDPNPLEELKHTFSRWVAGMFLMDIHLWGWGGVGDGEGVLSNGTCDA